MVSLCLGAYLLLLLAVNLTATQRVITQTAASTLSDVLGTEVRIGSVEVGLFNRVILKDVLIKDQRGADLLRARLLTGKISLRSLFLSPLTLRSISLLDADVRLYKQTEAGPTNFQFVIDAFSSKEEKESAPLHLRINSLILRRVSVSYHERYRPDTPGLFSPSHVEVSNLDGNLSLRELAPDRISLRVRHLAFDEAKGFRLKNLRFYIQASQTSALVSHFLLTTPYSRLSQDSLRLSYDVRRGLDRLPATLSASGRLSDCRISARDVGCFVSLPTDANVALSLSTGYTVKPGMVKLNGLKLQETGGQLRVAADLSAYHAEGRLRALSVSLRRLESKSGMSRRIVSWLKADTSLVHLAERAGDLALSGQGVYRPGAASMGSASLSTDVGRIEAEGSYDGAALQGTFALHNAEPGRLLAKKDLPGAVSLHGDASVTFEKGKVVKAGGRAEVSQLTWRNRTYRDISLSSTYSGRRLTADVSSANPGLSLRLAGETAFDGKKPQAVRLKGRVSEFSPTALGLNTPYGDATFSADIDTDLSGLHTTHPAGHLRISDLRMQGGERGDYTLDQLRADITTLGRGSRLRVSSDFLQADFTGLLSAEKLKDAALGIAARALPALRVKTGAESNEEWYLRARVSDAAFFRKMLGADIAFSAPIYIEGTLHGNGLRSSLTVSGEDLTIGSQTLLRPRLFVYGSDSTYHCLAQTGKVIAGRTYKAVADLTAHDSRLLTSVEWYSNATVAYRGNVNCATDFYHTGRGTGLTTRFSPTTFQIADSLWHISGGEIAYLDKEWLFKDVSISRPGQLLNVEGRLSPHRNDSIVARLQRIDIAYILDLVDFHTVEFAGKASGTAVFSQQGSERALHASLDVPSFMFNGANMGDALIRGSWSPTDNRINLDADMRFPGGGGRGTAVKGFVSLRDRNLLLDISADGTRLCCLQPWMDGIFDNFDGEARGGLILYGPFRALDFEGDLRVKAATRVAATGVKYSVTEGRAILEPGRFIFKDFHLDDGRGGKGTADGYLQHTHLKNLRYAFDVQATRMLCYDQRESTDLPFSSTTYGTGTVRMQGYPGHFSADIALRTDPGTTLTYNLGTQTAQSKDDRIFRFHSLVPADTLTAHTADPAQHEAPADAPGSQTSIDLNFLIEATPAAQIRIITDPRAGDALTAYGNGNIRAAYHNKGDFEMYGTYTLTRGNYKVSLQDVIKKDLALSAGSSLTFTGNPLEADLALKAVYTVNGVSLSDLNYGANFAQKTARVDCILNIGGKARNPQIDFDLDLHNISDDEKQMVRQLIATDEDMTSQVIYLLGVGRFYTANMYGTYADTESGGQSSAAMRSFLSTTLTGQLNNAIASALGSGSKWSFGTNVNTGTLGWNEMEVDGLVQGRLLNDRLLINGNFGYRDHPTYTSNFVGDFDLRYLLTPRGTISLKAYSETNDRYFTKTALSTQGIGVTFQKEFNRLRELFRRAVRRQKEADERRK